MPFPSLAPSLPLPPPPSLSLSLSLSIPPSPPFPPPPLLFWVTLVSLHTLCLSIPQLKRLHQDFEYNLALLEGRDADLEKLESDVRSAGAALAGRERQVAELQAAHAAAQSGALVAICWWCTRVCERERVCVFM